MSNLDQEIADAQAKLERLKKKQRAAEAKERQRFAETLVVIINEIEDDNEVTVRALVDRAQAKIHEQDAKRREASKKATAKRRKAAQAVNNVNSDEQRVEPNDETDSQTGWGGYRVDS